MNTKNYGSKEMLAFFEIHPDNLLLPVLIARRNLVEDQKRTLEELASKVGGIQGLMDLEVRLVELNDAIRQRSIGNEASIVYDTAEDIVYLNREGKLNPVNLKRPERAVLKYLMQHSGKQLKLSSIADGASLIYGGYITIVSIPFYIWKIRRKLGDPYKKPKYIETVRGMGYRFIDQVTTTVQSGNAIYNVPTPQ